MGTALGPLRTEEIEAFVCGQMHEHEIPGLSVAVSQRGEVIYCRGFGYRDSREGLPATGDTLYELASVGKSMAALSLLILEERGALSLGDPLARHLQGFSMGGSPWSDSVCLSHLLSHTSGLPPTGALRYASRESLEQTVVDALAEAGDWQDWIDHPPIRQVGDLLGFLRGPEGCALGPPGRFFSYSNDGYALLGAVVESVDGRPFPRFVKEEILDPLQMVHTTFDAWPSADAEYTVSHARFGDGPPVPFHRWEHSPPMTAAGFCRSTAREMMQYAELFLGMGTYRGRRLLKDARIIRMCAPRVPIDCYSRYGYALMNRKGANGVRTIEHAGGGMGVRTHFGFCPELELSIMVMANAGWAPSGRIWFGLLNACLGENPATPRFSVEETRLAPSELRRWVGAYRSGEGHEVRVRIEDGQPYLCTRNSNYRLRPTGPGSAVYHSGGEDSEIEFVPDADGSVRALFIGYRMVQRV